MVFKCRNWNTLPQAGGYLDQPARLMNEMEASLNVYTRLKEYYDTEKRLKADPIKWHEWQKDNMELVQAIIKLEKEARTDGKGNY
jgi:hypothetical protein